MITPTLAELIKRALDNRQMDLHTALIARVESYDAKNQTVDVQPQIKRALSKADGEKVYESLPLIPDVPVLFPRAGGYFISFPIQKGDYVQLLVNERSIAEWWSEGRESGGEAMHSFDGAVAIPGLYPQAQSLNDAHTENLVLGKSEGPQIHICGDEIRLGGENCADSIALANKVLSELAKITQAFNSHVHGTPWGPTAQPILPMSTPVSVASQVVKTQ